jgi:hypothetical protein
MSVSGCSSHYKFVLGAGALPDCRRQAGKAKSVTNNLPILSVLAHVFFGNISFIVEIEFENN